MEDFSAVPGGVSGLLGGAVAVGFWALLRLRNLLSKDKTDRSADAAYRALIAAQQAQIDRSAQRIAHEVARNSQLEKALSNAIEQITGLRNQVSELSDEVASLRRQIAVYGGRE